MLRQIGITTLLLALLACQVTWAKDLPTDAGCPGLLSSLVQKARSFVKKRINPPIPNLDHVEFYSDFANKTLRWALPVTLSYVGLGIGRSSYEMNNWMTAHGSNFVIGLGAALGTNTAAHRWTQAIKHSKITRATIAAGLLMGNYYYEMGGGAQFQDIPDMISGAAAIPVFYYLSNKYYKRAYERALTLPEGNSND